MQKMCIRTRSLAALFATCTGLAISTAAFAVDTPETEPNDNKTNANTVGAITLNSGDSVSGTTTGTSTTTAGNGSSDYFRIKTSAQPLGIYRHQLALTTTGTAGHSATIRGLSQSGGVIGTTDNAAQTASTLTSPARTVVWYGFGKQEEVYYRVQGTASTTGTYTATLTDTTVTPVVSSATLYAGVINISTAGTGSFAIDSDFWLYDSNYDAIAGAGNDDEFATSNTTGRIIRTLTPGTYTLAVSRFNLANNQASPADDDFRSGTVLDFPNAVLGSSVNPSGATSTGTANVLVNDGVNPVATIPLSFPANTIGDVQFAQFTLIADPNPTGGCCLVTGTCVTATAAGCGVQGGVYQGDGSACGSITCPQPGSCCDSGGCCTVTLQASCAVTSIWTSGGTCSPNICAAPVNDLCSAAIALTAGVQVSGSNCNATSTNDGPAATCQSSAGKAVWYTFTPAASGNFSISTCGSPQDTVLQVLTTPDCTTFTTVACDDDACDGITPPGSANASLISSVALTGGTTYYVRVATFGSAPTGGAYVLVVNSIVTGACCNNSTGVCSITSPSGCTTGSVYQGDNTTCTPDPCPKPGSCCVAGSCCTVTLQANCTGTWGGPSSTCTTVPCTAPANDLCSGAIALSNGVAVTGTNCDATSTNDGPAATCQSSAGKGVWYTFTPAHTAAYSIGTCGSTQDTVLQVFTTPDCTTFTAVACDDDTCDGITPAGSTLASFIASTTLNAGTTYYVRVSTFSTGTPVGGPFTLVVNNVNPLGSCCAASGTCTQSDAANCASGTFNAGGTCSPNTCPQPNGACCQGATCSVQAPAACTGTNTSFAGSGTACNAFPAATSPCCLADYNHVGGITVQDIFDFLAGYFGADPFADINGSGLSVQDIFDFLASYFGGGC